ncbi:putative peptidoglycan binding protein [Roseimicrobium gellanilyticum]|uniref:Putative peptidoglycan binding protein n=1 Tax=Roseimicrobium gellanilyticum TaxID=748857 RepID=A0A366HEW1_9BACT|nr:L,D-transpeptidase family protein [Roseimicrobium gellanilyticum]RBP40459.1 putative peptidoglycan binding protein [Roseimicrobium gellanilyticum]
MKSPWMSVWCGVMACGLMAPMRGIAQPAVPKAIPVEEVKKSEDPKKIERLQVYLDREGFPPGQIDGKWGEFTGKALKRLQMHRNGVAANAAVDLPTDFDVFTEYTVKEEDFSQVGEVGATPEEQSKQKSSPYPTMVHFLKERFHCDGDYLRKLNPGLNMDALKAGDVVRVPNVTPFLVEKLKVKDRIQPKPQFQKRMLRVDTKEKMLDVMENGKVLAAFPITPGSESLPAPVGTWEIETMTTLPLFRRDESMLKTGVRSDVYHLIPPGPSSAVGVLWMQLNKKGIGIHGTNNSETIGRAASHGCIRLANWDAVRLSEMVTDKVVVEIMEGVGG